MMSNADNSLDEDTNACTRGIYLPAILSSPHYRHIFFPRDLEARVRQLRRTAVKSIGASSASDCMNHEVKMKMKFSLSSSSATINELLFHLYGNMKSILSAHSTAAV